MSKKKLTKIIVSVLLIYGILLLLLIAAENSQGADGQGITDIGKALWYLIATLTTVGYGDITPVTSIGKLIGVLLMVSSAGVLTFLLGLMFSLLFGSLLPGLKLWLYRRKKWFVFSCLEERTLLLARKIAKGNPDAAYIFIGQNSKNFNDVFFPIKHFVIVDNQPESVLAMQKSASESSVFFMSHDGWENYDNAWALYKSSQDKKIQIFCETEYKPEHIPVNMTVFSRSDIIARSFWLHYPPEHDERIIVLVGDDKLTRNILERALLINVYPDDHPVEYHVFGDWCNFRRDHYILSNTVSVNESKAGWDSIFFHNEPWNDSHALLEMASRIVFCADDEAVNLSNMSELYNYYPISGRVYVCAKMHENSKAVFFGADDHIFTKENVIQNKINHLAIQLNELYRQKSGSGSKWEELSLYQRQSNIAAADHLLTKVRLLLSKEQTLVVSPETFERAYKEYCSYNEEQKEDCRRLEHKRWMRFHYLNNWQYDPVRNNNKRRHNLLVPYDKLTLQEQSYDDSAWEILNEVK
ncbi:MAG: ion transporter [Butyrivibrio sp.]|nr:ion transporter [Butyrivibrio sp.]